MNKKYGKNLLVVIAITLAIFLCGCSTEKEASNSGHLVSEEVAAKTEEMVTTESTSQAAS